MELIVIVALVFIVISWIGGVSGSARSSSNRSDQGYSKTNAPASNYAARQNQRRPDQGPGNTPSNRPRTSGGNRQTARPSGNSAWTQDNMNRSNNSPLRKSTFNNHEESSSYLRDEIKEAKILWDMNKARMKSVNDDFNRAIEKQHQEQQRMMQNARSIDH